MVQLTIVYECAYVVLYVWFLSDSGDIHRMGPTFDLVVPFWVSFTRRDKPKSEIFGWLKLSKMFRAAMSLCTIWFLCKWYRPLAMPEIIKSCSLRFDTSDVWNSFVSRLPPSQNSRIITGYGPSDDTPSICTTLGWGRKSLKNWVNNLTPNNDEWHVHHELRFTCELFTWCESVDFQCYFGALPFWLKESKLAHSC